MKKFWSWIVALVISPFIMAIFIGAVYGFVWLIINVGNPNSGHLPEIAGAVFIVVALTILVKVSGISDLIIDWISKKRRGL